MPATHLQDLGIWLILLFGHVGGHLTEREGRGERESRRKKGGEREGGRKRQSKRERE